MRLALLFAAVLVAQLALGFGPPYATTITAAFPITADGFSSGLRVEVYDTSRLVQRVDATDGAYSGGAPWIVADTVSGAPNELVIDWMGGACLARIRVLVKPIDAGLRLRLMEERTLGGVLGCMAVGVGRRLVLHLWRPISPQNVELEYPFG